MNIIELFDIVQIWLSLFLWSDNLIPFIVMAYLCIFAGRGAQSVKIMVSN